MVHRAHQTTARTRKNILQILCLCVQLHGLLLQARRHELVHLSFAFHCFIRLLGFLNKDVSAGGSKEGSTHTHTHTHTYL